MEFFSAWFEYPGVRNHTHRISVASDVRSALDKVKTNLYLNNRSFKVAPDDVSFYMQNHVSSYTYTQNNIYIHMQVPISDNDIIYEIYQTNVFPISLYSNDPHNTGYTIITNAAELFAADRSKSHILN